MRRSAAVPGHQRAGLRAPVGRFERRRHRAHPLAPLPGSFAPMHAAWRMTRRRASGLLRRGPEGSRMSRRIGFIGAGLMGHGMARNIVEKGYPLTVLGHRNRAP